jgi:hypothetical protein
MQSDHFDIFIKLLNTLCQSGFNKNKLNPCIHTNVATSFEFCQLNRNQSQSATKLKIFIKLNPTQTKPLRNGTIRSIN